MFKIGDSVVIPSGQIGVVVDVTGDVLLLQFGGEDGWREPWMSASVQPA